jgi:hypothetical protein
MRDVPRFDDAVADRLGGDGLSHGERLCVVAAQRDADAIRDLGRHRGDDGTVQRRDPHHHVRGA